MGNIKWTEFDTDFVDLDWRYEEPPKGRKHLIAIEVDEGESDIGVLVAAVVASFRKEVEAMRELLRKEGVAVSHRYERHASGRFSLHLDDRAEQIRKHLQLDCDHHLVTTPAEEPDNGTWTDEFDWEIEHPERCTPEVRYDDLCPFQVEIEYAGRDIFGKPKDWGEPPFRKRVRHVVEHFPGGPWGAEEWDVYVVEDPEEDGHDDNNEA